MIRYTLLCILLIFSLFLNAQVSTLISNNWQTFMWPYNAYFPLNASGPNGHIGNACGHTAMARILHYWQHPVNGEGILDFNDFFGNHWYVDLENLDLDYGQMPAMLNWGDPQTVYGETAWLFLACGALGEKVNIGFTDGIFRLPDALNTYMRFSIVGQPSLASDSNGYYYGKDFTNTVYSEIQENRIIVYWIIINKFPMDYFFDTLYYKPDNANWEGKHCVIIKDKNGFMITAVIYPGSEIMTPKQLELIRNSKEFKKKDILINLAMLHKYQRKFVDSYQREPNFRELSELQDSLMIKKRLLIKTRKLDHKNYAKELQNYQVELENVINERSGR